MVAPMDEADTPLSQSSVRSAILSSARDMWSQESEKKLSFGSVRHGFIVKTTKGNKIAAVAAF